VSFKYADMLTQKPGNFLRLSLRGITANMSWDTTACVQHAAFLMKR
jgi:hypothetical protein